MRKGFFTAFLLLACVAAAQNKHVPQQTLKPETPHLAFVKEFIRELLEDEVLKASGEKEFDEAKTVLDQFSTSIYVAKSTQLELRSQIGLLKGMRLRPPYDSLIPSLITIYEREISLQQKVIDIDNKLLSGPKPGVDYSTIPSTLPEIRAELEQAQKTLFEASPLVFMTLIDSKADSQGHLSHLLITKAEKADLEDQLNIMLKDEPDTGDHDFWISSAMILRGGLQKGHKCADEPWE